MIQVSRILRNICRYRINVENGRHDKTGNVTFMHDLKYKQQ